MFSQIKLKEENRSAIEIQSAMVRYLDRNIKCYGMGIALKRFDKLLSIALLPTNLVPKNYNERL